MFRIVNYFCSLPQPDRQQKVLDLVHGYFPEALVICPTPELSYPTLLEMDSPQAPTHPFNYAGIVPSGRPIWEQGQFVFDRTLGGELVRFMKLPEWCGIAPDDQLDDWVPGHHAFKVCVRGGGCYWSPTDSDSESFALLLNLIRLRYCPNLIVIDDGFYEQIGGMLWRLRIISTVIDESLDFAACKAMFVSEYMKRYAPFDLAGGDNSEDILAMVRKEIEERKVDDLELSIRTSQCLEKAGIKTIGELLHYSPAELLKIRNLGRKSVNELEEILQEFGVHLRSDARADNTTAVLPESPQQSSRDKE